MGMQKEDKKAEQREQEIAEKLKQKKSVRDKRTVAKKETLVKKWKGKDWFAILSPDIFGKKVISETPTTDPESLKGRVIEVSVPELIGDQTKYYMKMRFKVDKIDKDRLLTVFHGFQTSKEQIFRIVRKGSQRVDTHLVLNTKDGYKLRVGHVAVLNRNVNATLQSKFRDFVAKTLTEGVENSSLDDLVKGVMAGVVQRKIKKLGSKIYPVRFSEILKIEVMARPEKA